MIAICRSVVLERPVFDSSKSKSFVLRLTNHAGVADLPTSQAAREAVRQLIDVGRLFRRLYRDSSSLRLAQCRGIRRRFGGSLSLPRASVRMPFGRAVLESLLLHVGYGEADLGRKKRCRVARLSSDDNDTDSGRTDCGGRLRARHCAGSQLLQEDVRALAEKGRSRVAGELYGLQVIECDPAGRTQRHGIKFEARSRSEERNPLDQLRRRPALLGRGDGCLAQRPDRIACRAAGALPGPTIRYGRIFLRGRSRAEFRFPFFVGASAEMGFRERLGASVTEMSFARQRLRGAIAASAAGDPPQRRRATLRSPYARKAVRMKLRTFSFHLVKLLGLRISFMQVYVLRARSTRRALTLIELVVVIAILAILAAIVLPKFDNMTGQANAAVDASIVSDINRAVGTYETLNKGKFPSGNDGLLSAPLSSTFYSKFHPNIQIQGVTTTLDPMLPILYPVTLTAAQAKVLRDAGITSAHFNTESVGASSNPTGMPSDSGTAWGTVNTGSVVAGLFIPLNTGTDPAWTAHGSTFPDRAFNLNPFNFGKTDTFVVFGVGQPSQLRGKALQESPLVQAVDPTKYYARMFIVFRIPDQTIYPGTPLKYVGAFAPDGTSLNDNVRAYNSITSN